MLSAVRYRQWFDVVRKKARWLDFRCGRQKVAIVKQPLLDGETIEKRIRSAGDDNSLLPIVRMYPNVRPDLASLSQPDHVPGPRSARPAFQRAGFSIAEGPRGVPLTLVCRAPVKTCAPFNATTDPLKL
jgi:hypothetical protein